jgi:hypothetical protein
LGTMFENLSLRIRDSRDYFENLASYIYSGPIVICHFFLS